MLEGWVSNNMDSSRREVAPDCPECPLLRGGGQMPAACLQTAVVHRRSEGLNCSSGRSTIPTNPSLRRIGLPTQWCSCSSWYSEQCLHVLRPRGVDWPPRPPDVVHDGERWPRRVRKKLANCIILLYPTLLSQWNAILCYTISDHVIRL